MIKKILLLTGVTIILALFTVFMVLMIPKIKREGLNPNKISVQVADGIDINDIQILWGYEANSSKTLFKEGRDLKKKYKEYGNNTFLVCYKDSTVAKFHQYKYNDWHGHHYYFDISYSNDSIVVDWTVKGPDSDRCYMIP